MSALSFDRALLSASRRQALRLAELEAEHALLIARNQRLVVTNANLRRRLIEARDAQHRWRVRHATWRVERDELLAHVPPNVASRVALGRWGPEN